MADAGVLTRIDAAGFALAKQLLSLSWQFVLLSVMALIAGWVLKRTSAGLRHRIWTGVFIIVPLIPILVVTAGWIGTPRVEVRVLPPYTSPGPLKTTLPTDSELADPAVKADMTVPRYTYPWALMIMGYGFGVCVLLGLIVAGRLRLEYCRRSGHGVADRRVHGIFEEVRAQLGITRQVTLVESGCVESPLTIGTFHPAVIMPEGFVDSLSGADIRAFATHELTHVKRYDSLLLFYVSVVRALLFFNPAVWFATRQLCLIAEHACDDMVVATDNAPLDYAEMLVRIARGLTGTRPAADLTAGFFITNHQFLYRIEQIVDDRHERITTLTKRALTGYVASGFAAVFLVVAVPIGEMPHIDLKTVYEGIPLVRTMVLRAHVIDRETGDPVPGVHLYTEDESLEIVSNEHGYIELPGVKPGVTMLHVARNRRRPGRFRADSWLSIDGRPAGRLLIPGFGRHPFAPPRPRPVTILIEPGVTVAGTMYDPGRAERLEPEHIQPEVAEPGMSLPLMALDIHDIDTPTAILVMPNMSISGTVYDPVGNPVPGATVMAARTGTGNSISGDMRYSVLTGDDGRYTIYLPASGEARYNLMAVDSVRGGEQRWANGVTAPMKTKSGMHLDKYDIVLSQPSSIHGQVVDTEGKPLAGRMVMAFSLDGLSVSQHEPYAKTGPDGRFEITSVRPGDVRVMLMQVSTNGACKPEATEGSMLSLIIDEHHVAGPVTLVDTGRNNSRLSPSARRAMIRMTQDGG